MRRVFLSKIRLSMVAKIPGMAILGVLAIAFLLFPLATALAQGCGGGGGAAAQAATLESHEGLFSSTCGGTPLSNAQASELASTWAKPPTANGSAKPAPSSASGKTTNATIGTTTTTKPSTTTTPSTGANPNTTTTPNNGVLSGLSLMGAVARCSFVTVPNGQKVQLQDGDICLITVQGQNGTDTAIIGEVIGGQLIAVAGQNGQHFQRIVQNPNIKLTNAVLPQN